MLRLTPKCVINDYTNTYCYAIVNALFLLKNVENEYS